MNKTHAQAAKAHLSSFPFPRSHPSAGPIGPQSHAISFSVLFFLSIPMPEIRCPRCEKLIDSNESNAGSDTGCACGKPVFLPSGGQKEPGKSREPVNAIISGPGVALCPLCGARTLYKKHNVGIIKRCSNCGQKLVLSKWRSCLVTILALAISAVGTAIALAH